MGQMDPNHHFYKTVAAKSITAYFAAILFAHKLLFSHPPKICNFSSELMGILRKVLATSPTFGKNNAFNVIGNAAKAPA